MRKFMFYELMVTRALASCKSWNRTQKGAVIGTVDGAAAGIVIGKASGNTAGIEWDQFKANVCETVKDNGSDNN